MNSEKHIHPRTEQVNKQQVQDANKLRVDALEWLAETFPEAFNTEKRVRPLKKGILQDVLDYIEENSIETEHSRTKIREAIIMFTRRMEYLVCVKCRNDRIDLNGEFAGEVTDEEAEYSAEKIRLHVEAAIEKAEKPPRSRRYEACEKFAPRLRDVIRKEQQNRSRPHSQRSHSSSHQQHNQHRGHNHNDNHGNSHHYHKSPSSHHQHTGMNGYPSDHAYNNYNNQQHMPMTDNGNNSLSASPSSAGMVNQGAQTQVTVKRKVAKKIDPDAVARLKEKLGIKKESA